MICSTIRLAHDKPLRSVPNRSINSFKRQQPHQLVLPPRSRFRVFGPCFRGVFSAGFRRLQLQGNGVNPFLRVFGRALDRQRLDVLKRAKLPTFLPTAHRLANQIRFHLLHRGSLGGNRERGGQQQCHTAKFFFPHGSVQIESRNFSSAFFWSSLNALNLSREDWASLPWRSMASGTVLALPSCKNCSRKRSPISISVRNSEG